MYGILAASGIITGTIGSLLVCNMHDCSPNRVAFLKRALFFVMAVQVLTLAMAVAYKLHGGMSTKQVALVALIVLLTSAVVSVLVCVDLSCTKQTPMLYAPYVSLIAMSFIQLGVAVVLLLRLNADSRIRFIS